jgi:hypothetical protein
MLLQAASMSLGDVLQPLVAAVAEAAEGSMLSSAASMAAAGCASGCIRIPAAGQAPAAAAAPGAMMVSLLRRVTVEVSCHFKTWLRRQDQACFG